DLKSAALIRLAGSIPVPGTNNKSEESDTRLTVVTPTSSVRCLGQISNLHGGFLTPNSRMSLAALCPLATFVVILGE
ncbi:MAG: hypothetical protein WC100_14480, partial [Sterolibacterium sp.]